MEMSKMFQVGNYEVSAEDWESTPASIQALVWKLVKENEELKEKVLGLEVRLGQIEERLNQNSRNSSRPPSKDEPGEKKEEKSKQQEGRKRGGQTGHKGNRRYLYRPEECQQIEEVKPLACGHCGGELRGEDENPYRHQVVEIPPIKPEIIEYRLHRLTCPKCGHGTRAKLPEGVTKKGYGERLTGLVGLLSAHHHQSHGLVQELLREVFGVVISTGGINRLRQELNEAVAARVEEAKIYVQSQKMMNSDETGFSQHNGDGINPENRKAWLWVLVTPLVSYFEIVLLRSQETARSLIDSGFKGIVTSDRYGAYNWLPVEQRQICWAHLKRDFVAMSQRSGVSAEIGDALLRRQRRLFRWWHRVRDGTMSYELFVEAVSLLRRGFQRELESAAALDVGPKEKTPLAKTVRTCRQILKVEPALWNFVNHPQLEPTNNAAEQALRPAVIWRRLSFGSKSQGGSDFVARMLTVTTSLGAQKRSVLDFLTQACHAARFGLQPPSLLPDL
jgi:hypothetical protein